MDKIRATLFDLRKVAKALVRINGHLIEHWLSKNTNTQSIMHSKCELCNATIKVLVENNKEEIIGDALKNKCNGKKK